MARTTRGIVPGAALTYASTMEVGGGEMDGPRRGFTVEQARASAAGIGLDLETAPFDVDQFRRGMEVELEHGRRDAVTDVTGDDPLMTAKIAWAHLRELPDYYDRLERMEAEGEHSTP
jgi:hypothetical protein